MNLTEVKDFLFQHIAQESISITKVAELTGFSRQYLYMMKSGAVAPTVGALSKIADVLGFDLDFQLRKRKDNEAPHRRRHPREPAAR